jgi:tetratricopeptide (TPR) repeat protein
MASSNLILRTFVPLLAAWVIQAGLTFGQVGEAPGALAEKIDVLITQLGDGRFTVRERAQTELAEIGAPAFDALSAAQSHRDLEIAHRSRLLVQSIRMDWVRETDSIEVRNLLDDYDSQPDSERLNRIQQLARLPQDESLAPLSRLVRFERSVLVSKLAAILIMDQKRPTASAWPARSRTILDEIRYSKRPAVRWLAAYAEFPGNPTNSLEAWNTFVREEDELGKRSATHEQRGIQAGLLRQQVIMLLDQKKTEDALVALRRMLDLGNTDPDSLAALLEWIIRQEAWPLVNEVAERFQQKLVDNPYLMYLVAHAHLEQGNGKLAEELAGKALAQKPGNPREHLEMATRLQQQGLMKWSEREYREVIKDDSNPSYSMFARSRLAELLNDYEQFGEAADLLDEVVEQIENERRNGVGRRGRRQQTNIDTDKIKARAHFMRAKQYAVDNEPAKQLEQLHEAIDLDSTEADVLITLYRLKDQPKEERENTMEMIRRAALLFRQQVAASPEDSTPLNQYAWLIANTEGDFDEAIRFSQRSIELAAPAQLGGYLDTLAHCYSAKKDYANALKHQSRAKELEPHSQEIRRAYERFKRLHEEGMTK